MSLFRDQYLKSFGKKAYNRTEHCLGVIETWGELREEVRVFDYTVKPFDEQRDFNNIETPQRLIVDMNIALRNEDKTYNPHSYVSDICAIFALVTGRLMRASEAYGFKIDEKNVIDSPKRCSYRAHPNITTPIQNNNLQSDIDQLIQNLISVKSKDDLQKHLTLMRVIRLYNDSLCLVPIDEDAAYVLLVAAGEALGSEFSSINPTFNDLPNSNKLIKLIEEYELDEGFKEKLSEILTKPRHLKLRAKFVDVITTYLRSDFFDNLDKVYIPYIQAGSYDLQTHQAVVKEWGSKEAEGFGNAGDLEKYLKNIYDMRSSFVHAGYEFPYNSKTSFGILTNIKTDKSGNPIKNTDGSHKYEKPLPSYFWFERVMNSVIQNTIKSFGQKS